MMLTPNGRFELNTKVGGMVNYWVGRCDIDGLDYLSFPDLHQFYELYVLYLHKHETH